MKRSSFSTRFLPSVVGLALYWPVQAQACPMCMGAPDSNTGEALNGAIFLMLGCIGAMIAGIGAVAFSIARKARSVASTQAEFH